MCIRGVRQDRFADRQRGHGVGGGGEPGSAGYHAARACSMGAIAGEGAKTAMAPAGGFGGGSGAGDGLNTAPLGPETSLLTTPRHFRDRPVDR